MVLTPSAGIAIVLHGLKSEGIKHNEWYNSGSDNTNKRYKGNMCGDGDALSVCI